MSCKSQQHASSDNSLVITNLIYKPETRQHHEWEIKVRVLFIIAAFRDKKVVFKKNSFQNFWRVSERTEDNHSCWNLK